MISFIILVRFAGGRGENVPATFPFGTDFDQVSLPQAQHSETWTKSVSRKGPFRHVYEYWNYDRKHKYKV